MALNISPKTEFCGKPEIYFNENIRPNLPTSAQIQSIHRQLTDYLISSDSKIFIHRTFKALFKKLERGMGTPWPTDPKKIIFGSDNEAALWLFARTLDGDFTNGRYSFSDVITKQLCPIGFAKESGSLGTWKTWGRNSRDAQTFRGLMHAHLLDCKRGLSVEDFSEKMLKARMIRLLHPINHFIVPSPKRVQGYLDISEMPGIKKIVSDYWQRECPDVWQEYLDLASGAEAIKALSTGSILDLKQSELAEAKELKTRKPKNCTELIDLDIWVYRGQILEMKNRLEYVKDESGKTTKNLQLVTNKSDYIFIVEKPTLAVIEKILSALPVGLGPETLVYIDTRAPNPSLVKPQYYTRFPGCYVQKKGFRISKNVIEYKDEF